MAINSVATFSKVNLDYCSQNYTFEKPRFQNFSIPSNIIYYIIHSNLHHPKAHEKLIKTCKYFFFKKPFFHIHNLDCAANNKNFIIIFLQAPKSKVWLTGKFVIYSQFYTQCENTASRIIQKLYRCDVKILRLTNQTLSLDEFVFLISSNFLKLIDFFNISVKDKNGELVPFQKLCEYLIDIKKIYYAFSIEENEANTITDLPNFKNLKIFHLKNAPINIEIGVINEFLQKHSKTDISLNFSSVPNYQANFEIQLQELVDDILNAGVTETYPPLISFSGQKKDAFRDLFTLRRAYLQRHRL